MYGFWDLQETLLCPLNPPSSQVTKSHAEKWNTMNQRSWIKQCSLWGERKKEKSPIISHNQHRTSTISTPISIKKKEYGHEKKRISTPEARKRKKGGKLKESKLITSN